MENKIKKQSIGRQKIEIKRIEKKSSLQVAFSKRRSGLFKKVAEFSTLCGADAAVFVESPGGKLFTFGNPSPEHVISRYLGLNKDDQNSLSENKVATETDNVCANNYEEAMKIESVEELTENDFFWWRKSTDHMGLEELEEFKNALEGLKSNIMVRPSPIEWFEIHHKIAPIGNI